MHHDPLSQERALNLSILTVSQNLVSFPFWGSLCRRLHSWVVPTGTSSKTGTAMIAVALIIWPSCECKRWNWRRTCNNKRQRRDWRGNARARWWRWADTLARGPGLCTTAIILRATQRQRCCHVGGLLPYLIRIACSLSSRLMAALFGAAATAGAAGAADSSTSVGASSLSLL